MCDVRLHIDRKNTHKETDMMLHVAHNDRPSPINSNEHDLCTDRNSTGWNPNVVLPTTLHGVESECHTSHHFTQSRF